MTRLYKFKNKGYAHTCKCTFLPERIHKKQVVILGRGERNRLELDLWYLYFSSFLKTEEQLIYSTVLISGVQQSTDRQIDKTGRQIHGTSSLSIHLVMAA